MLPLPSLFNSFEGFVLSLLLTQSHRKKKKKNQKKLIVKLFVINCESLKDLLFQIKSR